MFSGSGSPCGSEDDGTSGSGASGEDNVSSKTSQNESEDGSDEMPEPDPAQKKSPDKRPRGRTKASHTPRVGDEEGDVDCGDGKYSEELRNSLVLALTKLREKSQQQDRDYKKEKALREKAEEALSEQETALRRAQKTTEEKVKRLKEEREAALASKVSVACCLAENCVRGIGPSSFIFSLAVRDDLLLLTFFSLFFLSVRLLYF